MDKSLMKKEIEELLKIKVERTKGKSSEIKEKKIGLCKNCGTRNLHWDKESKTFICRSCGYWFLDKRKVKRDFKRYNRLPARINKPDRPIFH